MIKNSAKAHESAKSNHLTTWLNCMNCDLNLAFEIAIITRAIVSSMVIIRWITTR